MDFLIVDLEATCWLDGTTPGRQEVIEIGAVRVRAPHFQPEETFARFVRPLREPELSDFCTHLTGIQQVAVNTADHGLADLALRSKNSNHPNVMASAIFVEPRRSSGDWPQ